MPEMKPIRLTKHATEQAAQRGASTSEVEVAIRFGEVEPAKGNRQMARYNLEFNREWAGHYYPIKQVAPVFVDEEDEIVVITVYTFYF
jgi:hypothetical protein